MVERSLVVVDPCIVFHHSFKLQSLSGSLQLQMSAAWCARTGPVVAATFPVFLLEVENGGYLSHLLTRDGLVNGMEKGLSSEDEDQ